MNDNEMHISPSVLTWARETARIPLDKMIENFPYYKTWEVGINYPTYEQLMKLSDKFHRPFVVFFYPEPPEKVPEWEDDLRFKALFSRSKYKKLYYRAFSIYLDLIETEKSMTDFNYKIDKKTNEIKIEYKIDGLTGKEIKDEEY